MNIRNHAPTVILRTQLVKPGHKRCEPVPAFDQKLYPPLPLPKIGRGGAPARLLYLIDLVLLPDLFSDFLWVVESSKDLFQNSRHVEELFISDPQNP